MAREKRRGGRERPHRPHDLGPRVFRRGRWWAADLRPWGGGRPTLRNPRARGWPGRGNRTEDEEVARRWAWAYVDLYREERRRRDLGLRGPDRPIGELADQWHRWRELQGRARKTIEGGRTATGHLIDSLGADFPVEDVSQKLQGFFDSFLEEGYEPRTLDTLRRQLSSFFRWAGLEPNPARKRPATQEQGAGISLPRFPASKARAWTPEKLLRIRHAADEAGLRLAVELALGTGARQAELWALEREAVSEARRTVEIRRQLADDGTRKERLKGHRSRVAVVLPFVWDHLPDSGGLLLHDGNGNPVKPRQSRDLLLEVLEDAGVAEAGIGWHSFRHTYSWLFLDAGGSVHELQKSLGHASVRTTELIYGHWSSEDASSRAAARMYGDQRPHLRVIK